MTAFEILLNKFYDIIEKNEPSSDIQETNQNHSELNTVIKKFIDASFFSQWQFIVQICHFRFALNC